MADPVRLVVGLGNPGDEYAQTRHNAGFMVVDELARRFGITSWKKKHDAVQAMVSAKRLLLIKPVTYMNNSGVPVKLISHFYRTPPRDILVITDDKDLPFGTLRMRAAGGHGGHNGLRSIIGTIGEEFPRLRVGLGEPQFDTIDHVLSTFSTQERAELPRLIGLAADGVERWLDQRIELAMNFVNAARVNSGTEPDEKKENG